MTYSDFSKIVALLFVSIPVIFIILAILQSRLGKAEIKITNGETFTPGDTVEGEVTISSDKRQEVKEVRAILACSLVRRSRNSNHKSGPLPFFTEKVTVGSNLQIMPGRPFKGSFSIPIPTSIPDLPDILMMQAGVKPGELPGVEKASPSTEDKGLMESAFGIALSKPTWKVYSEADISFGTIKSDPLDFRLVEEK